MKVQYVSLTSTPQADEAGAYKFTPELLAAIGARYSRNNEGLDAISSKIDPSNLDKSVDSIFKMVDYGHASIADMAPLAFFIDEISLYAAYYLWTLCPTAGGQECSTRYIKLDHDGLVSAEDLGIPDDQIEYFEHFNKCSFETYQIALESWSKIAEADSNLTKIPEKLLNSDLEKDKKAVARMKRNFAYDRARVFLPLSASTGVMMVQSARAWANLCAHLNSHYLKELRLIGQKIAENLYLGAPRLVKHAQANDSIKSFIEKEFKLLSDEDNNQMLSNFHVNEYSEVETEYYLDVQDLMYDSELIEDACSHRTNRYSPFGNVIARTNVKFCWLGMSFGEIRDLNRHRTGTKYCPLVPLGFYGSIDQLPNYENDYTSIIRNSVLVFKDTAEEARKMLIKNVKEYIYFTNLGHQYYFEHSTTADKFLYEMELRTGVGAHYRYAQHCKDMLRLWYKKYPRTKGLIFEGSAEPE